MQSLLSVFCFSEKSVKGIFGEFYQLYLASTMSSFTSKYSVFNETTMETKENVRELAMFYLMYQIGKLDINL